MYATASSLKLAAENASRVKIGLVQINHSAGGQTYLPYSVAVLQAFAERSSRNPARLEFMLPVFKRLPINQIVAYLTETDIVGFSTYVWNGRISLEIARRLKEKKPKIVTVFGGPQVPGYAAEGFLRDNPFVDIAVHNEGERAFVQLLDQHPHIDGSVISGVSFIGRDGDFHHNPSGPRIRNLDEIPSPFLSGVLDRLLESHPNEFLDWPLGD